MNTHKPPLKPLSNPLHLPAFVILLAATALAIAGLQWLAARLRSARYAPPHSPMSREFAERFGARLRIPHQS